LLTELEVVLVLEFPAGLCDVSSQGKDVARDSGFDRGNGSLRVSED